MQNIISDTILVDISLIAGKLGQVSCVKMSRRWGTNSGGLAHLSVLHKEPLCVEALTVDTNELYMMILRSHMTQKIAKYQIYVN